MSVAGTDVCDPVRPTPSARWSTPTQPLRWAAAVVVLLLAVSIALIMADRRSRAHEFDQLLDQVRHSQALLGQEQLGAAKPQPTSSELAQLAADRQAIAGLRPFRWHTAPRRARDDYLAYLDAEIDYLRRTTVDAGERFRPHPEFASLLSTAQRSLATASTSDTEAHQARTLLHP